MTGADMRCTSWCPCGDRTDLEVEQQRYLSLMALELLTDIIPSAPGNSIFRNATRPTCNGKFCVVSSANTTSAIIDDDSLESVAVVGDLLRGLGR
jgi:hypothetical protein